MGNLKITFAALLAATLAVPAVFSAEGDNGSRPQMRSWGERGNRGNRMGRFGRMQDPRTEAEQKLKEQYPAEFAEIQKLRDEAEKKLQELAKKANIELPARPKSWQERMADLKKKYPKEYAEYEELQKTDRRAAFAKLREMMEKDGQKMGFPGRAERPAPPPPRENVNRKLRELKKKYPAEFAEIQKVHKENPAKARQMTQDLLKKAEKESGK